MRATVDFFDQSLVLTVFEDQGNTVRVLVGGADGVLVTVSGDGAIGIIPPEGPGDPELLEAFRKFYAGLGTIIHWRLKAGGPKHL
jgi:hypothetical protein